MGRFEMFIKTEKDLCEAVERLGIVPFFKNCVPGFSIAENVDRSAWFEDGEGVWEWKGPVIRKTKCAYGKLFCKKAAFVREDLFRELANFRRDGYDLDARFDDGLAPASDKFLFELTDSMAPVVTQRLKEAGNYRRGGRKGFDVCMTRLQAECYVIIGDFVYPKDRHGRPYGWGTSLYTTPERFFGEGFRERVYSRPPRESYERLFEHIRGLFPDAPDKMIARFLR